MMQPLSIVSHLLLLQFLPAVLLTLLVLTALGIVVINCMIVRRKRKGMHDAVSVHEMMERALKISDNNVILYDVATRFTSKLSGRMFPEQGLGVDEFLKRVHPDDRHKIIEDITSLRNGEKQTAEFDYRWDFNFGGSTPHWGYLHNTSVAEYVAGNPVPVSVISTLVNETKLHQQQEQEEALSGRYKQIFENSIIGLSFYSADGWLLDANKEMRRICNFDSDESDAFFSNTNLFDVFPFNEVLDKNHIEPYWGCSQCVIPERGIHEFLEIRVRPVYNENGEVTYLSVAARDVTEERELYLQQRLNDQQIQQANDKIQLYETELRYMMEACEMRTWRTTFADKTIQFYKGLSEVEHEVTYDELAGYFFDDSERVRAVFAEPGSYFDKKFSYMARMHPVFHETAEFQWNRINSIPVYDEKGNLTGAFGLIRNMSQMMLKQEQLKRETERANDSGHQKSVFLANMTHEIRTPLNAIVGFSDLLQTIDSPEEKREMIRIIHNNCDMLLRLINDILVLSNVDANAMQIRPENVDFAAEFADICTSLSERVQEPGVEFLSDNPCQSLLVCIDKSRIQQVITNFVTNAVKYTHQGHIRVGYRPEERSGRQGIYVYCEDTGAGIPADQLNRVFERFVKLNDYIQGTGLGLSICQAIIEKCNGEIGVESTCGEGSTFWFWIPV